MNSTEEIAEALFVSTNTVKTHLKGIFGKLGVNRRVDAVRHGRTLGPLLARAHQGGSATRCTRASPAPQSVHACRNRWSSPATSVSRTSVCFCTG